MRYTCQRAEILEYLKGNYSHPAVEQVYERVRKKLTRISQATVYRSLKLLATNGLVSEVKGMSTYEPLQSEHHYMICRGCGKIIGFPSKRLTDYSLKAVKKAKGIRVESASTNVYGVCKKCRRK